MKSRFINFSLVAALIFTGNNLLFANPTGITVVSGSAAAQANGSRLNVTTSQSVVLNWGSFNIQQGETTTFIQPSVNSVAINIIGGASPSQIFGNLNANGSVILANANGFYFGPNSLIKVGGSFIATTAPLTPDFGAGSAWQFTGLPPLANIVNYGQIQVGSGKSLFLIAEQIENHGELNAPGGDVGLYAGQSVLVSDRPDGRGLSATVQIPSGSVNNAGQITADAGTIALQAQVVNQNGIIQADSVQNQNGEIDLVASDQLKLGANSQILAHGDDSDGGSSGGKVTLKSGNNFSDGVGSRISVTGGMQGGNGGEIEISAPNVLSLNSDMAAGAQSGWLGGTFSLDPVNIALGTSTANGAINVNSAFSGFSQILLQASGNISLNPSAIWDLSASTGNGSGQLTLEAGGDITFGNNSKITDAGAWSVTLEAGYDFVNNTVQSGVGNIYLNGGSGLSQNASIQLSAGSINLLAGQSILLASQNNHIRSIVSGSVFTTGGGSIFAHALAGDIDAGTSNGGTSSTTQTGDFNFTDSGSTPNPVLGGFSTAAGGNVTLIAGNNIDSTPVVPSRQWPGALGAYGPGDVTIIAGNQINGNYMLANGVGTLLAGVPVQSAQAGVLQNPNADPAAYASTLRDLETAVTHAPNPNGNIGGIEFANGATLAVTLSLIQGSWNAWAANNILLKEVNNPNGTFNSAQSYLYNYAPDAAANFWAGNAIELAGGTVGGILARVSRGNQNIICAPSLSLNAGAGGIQVDKSIILAPSSAGSLNIVTRDGGNLNGAVTAGSTTLTGITMSDSGSTDYRTFGTGHAATPLHLNDPNPGPVVLDISGDINSLGLTVPTFAQVNVAGNTYNFGFLGQNLSPAQTTSINVAGDITYRGDLTSVPLSDTLPAFLFASTLSGDPEVAGKLRYDPTAGTLTFIGVMTQAELNFLLHPTAVVLDGQGNPVFQLDAQGNPVLDQNGNPVPVTQPVTLDAAQQAAIQSLYTASQSATLGDQGLALAGSGQFNIGAHNMDLGISGGISVLTPDSALAAISRDGANINIVTAGNLEMTSTRIANESYLGGINLNVGGTLDVGGEFTTFGDPGAPKGIFTTSGGNVSVAASGNVNVNGSRIAAYNGGNLTVESFAGDVNAGSGGSGYVTLNALELDPLTGQLVSLPASIPGSGILATTLPNSHAALGNILVEAPNGNISASAGGIIQISFNSVDASRAVAYALAGYELRDADGINRLTAQDLSSSYNLENNSDSSLALPDNLFDDSGVLIGKATYVSPGRNVDASGSGVIAQSIKVRATGEVKGLFVGRGSVDIGAGQIGPVVAYSPGPILLTGPIDPNGGPPILISRTDPTVNGLTTPQEVPQSNVAKENAETADDAATVVTKTDNQDDDDENKKKGKSIALTQKTSRITLILPGKNPSPASSSKQISNQPL